MQVDKIDRQYISIINNTIYFCYLLINVVNTLWIIIPKVYNNNAYCKI